MMVRRFLIAHAFGLPVVPDVKIRSAKSWIERGAGGLLSTGVVSHLGDFFLRKVTNALSDGNDIFSKEYRHSEICGSSPSTNGARSGVDII